MAGERRSRSPHSTLRRLKLRTVAGQCMFALCTDDAEGVDSPWALVPVQGDPGFGSATHTPSLSDGEVE